MPSSDTDRFKSPFYEIWYRSIVLLRHYAIEWKSLCESNLMSMFGGDVRLIYFDKLVTLTGD